MRRELDAFCHSVVELVLCQIRLYDIWLWKPVQTIANISVICNGNDMIANAEKQPLKDWFL